MFTYFNHFLFFCQSSINSSKTDIRNPLRYLLMNAVASLICVQVKTQKQKQLYNKYGKRKHSGGRAAAEASEAEMDPDEKAQGDPGILLSEICDGKQGTFRKILCQPVMRGS